jgi:hypothetical protein
MFSLMTLIVALAGCPAVLPPSDAGGLVDAANDGFLDVMPPDGVAFEPISNLRLRLVSSIDEDDAARAARAQGVPEDFIALLPFVSVVAIGDLSLHYPDGSVGMFTDSAMLEPFEKSYEFACPERVDVAVRVEVSQPLGGTDVLFEESRLSFLEGGEFVCGDTIAYEVFVDAVGQIRIEEIDAR